MAAGRAALALCLRRWSVVSRNLQIPGRHSLNRESAFSGRRISVSSLRHHQCWAWPSPDKIMGIGDSWTYGTVDYWDEHYPTCDGKRQSPVDLCRAAMKMDNTLGPFTFTDFDKTDCISVTIVNNGHSAQVTYMEGQLTMTGGGLDDEYGVVQYHFHWGSVDNRGSEHTVEGKAYPMEMHVVTFNLKYGSLDVAKTHPDGLAVLGFFFELIPEDNQAFNPLVFALRNIKNAGTVFGMAPVPLLTLFPKNLVDYYRYEGGLTTPPCSEVVTWTVFSQPILISAKQMAAFRSLLSSDVDPKGNAIPLLDNYRSLQPLHGRTIRVNF